MKKYHHKIKINKHTKRRFQNAFMKTHKKNYNIKIQRGGTRA